MPRKAIHQSAAARQAAYQARLRALTPLQRLNRLPVEETYTAEERRILAEIRLAQDTLEERAGRLNALVTARLNALAEDDHAEPAARKAAAVQLHLLTAVWRLTLPNF